MPTGYTAGILDGSINTFPEFAKLCMRAFGATMHLRDKSLNAEYEPQKVSKYHYEKIEEANISIQNATHLSDEVIIETRKKELELRIDNSKKNIKETENNRARLEAMLLEAREYKAPTPDHDKIKEFMIKQIEETTSFDGDASFFEVRLVEAEKELEKLDAKIIRNSIIEKANKDLAYHKAELTKEVKRVNTSNQWVIDFMDSLVR